MQRAAQGVNGLAQMRVKDELGQPEDDQRPEGNRDRDAAARVAQRTRRAEQGDHGQGDQPESGEEQPHFFPAAA